MRRLLVLSGLLAVLGLVSLIEPRPAYAAPYCWFMNGRACSPNGSTTCCIPPSGRCSNLCTCTDSLWNCPI
jgi:hypothetical protein